jgi:hypothetical protein
MRRTTPLSRCGSTPSRRTRSRTCASSSSTSWPSARPSTNEETPMAGFRSRVWIPYRHRTTDSLYLNRACFETVENRGAPRGSPKGRPQRVPPPGLGWLGCLRSPRVGPPWRWAGTAWVFHRMSVAPFSVRPRTHHTNMGAN